MDFAPHNLTSDTSTPPYVVTYSSIASGAFDAWQCFDGNPFGTGWSCDFADPAPWFQIDLGTGKTVLSYALSSMASRANMMASNITLQGSNDNVTWTNLDNRPTEVLWNNSSGETRRYIVSTPGSYRYYRIATNSDSGYIQIGELYLYSDAVGFPAGRHDIVPHSQVVDSAPPIVFSSTASHDGNAHEAFNTWVTSNGWLGTGSPPYWVQIDVGVGTFYIPDTYYFQVNLGQGPTCQPQDFTFQGSQDGTTWTVLDTQTGQSGASSDAYLTYSLTTTASFRYFRLNITANNGGSFTELATLSIEATPSPATPMEFAPHDLTSSTSHSPYLVTSSSQGGGNPNWHAFDGSVGDFWTSTASPAWLELDTASEYILTSYVLYSGANTSPQGPNTWTMEGSDDGSTWTTLDTQTGISGWTFNVPKTFNTPGVTTAYRYFRLNVSANNGFSGGIIEVDQLYLQGSLTPGTTPQTITFPGTMQLAATSSSGLPVTYSVTSGPGAIVSGALLVTGSGTIVVQATQIGSAIYAAASPVTQSFSFVDLVAHDLSSSTSHAPYVVTSSTQSGGNPNWHAFDGDHGDFWLSASGGAGTGWLQVDTGSATSDILWGYTVYSENDGNSPNSWTMQGSNDGTSWTTLDTQSGITGWAFNVPKSFPATGSAPFRFYRLNVTLNNNGGGGEVEIDELYLVGKSLMLTPTVKTITGVANIMARVTTQTQHGVANITDRVRVTRASLQPVYSESSVTLTHVSAQPIYETSVDRITSVRRQPIYGMSSCHITGVRLNVILLSVPPPPPPPSAILTPVIGVVGQKAGVWVENRWFVENIMRVATDANTFDFVDRQITGEDSGATAYVEGASQNHVADLLVTDLSISHIQKEFLCP